jgi:hypothetical protein
VDSGSESRSVVDGGSPRSVTQGSARSLPAFLEHTNVALYQVRAADTPIPGRELVVASLEEANQIVLGFQGALVLGFSWLFQHMAPEMGNRERHIAPAGMVHEPTLGVSLNHSALALAQVTPAQ